jgi:hypothetical protein
MVLHADTGLMVMLLVLLVDLKECRGCLRIQHGLASMILFVLKVMMVMVMVMVTMPRGALVRTGSKLA